MIGVETEWTSVNSWQPYPTNVRCLSMFLGQELLKAVQVFWQENVKGGSRCIAVAFNAYHGRISYGFDEKE